MAKLALCLVIQEVGGGPIDPGFGNIGGIGGLPHPGQGLPGFGHPDQGLPGFGHPSQGLPGQGGHPSQGLPGGGGLPSHPIHMPPAGTKPPAPGSSPGAGLWVVAYIPGKGFEWVSITPAVPEKPQPPGQPNVPTIPVNPDQPNQGLPGGGMPPHASGQPVPPTAGQPLPPTAQPKA
jgi:hypothetical protein